MRQYSFLKRKMAAKFASNLLAKQPIGGLPPFWAYFSKSITSSSRKFTSVLANFTSYVQVHLSVISVLLSNSNFNSKI
jgi:hypothetical protein